MERRFLFIALTSAFVALLQMSGGSAIAGTFDDIGFTKLQNELGDQLPTGAGVPVAQSEAPVATGLYYPDATLSKFADDNFIPLSGNQGVSWHANSVGANFYSSESIAPGISDINLFTAAGWNGSDFLQIGSSTPKFINARVANHSWISTDSSVSTTLSKFDWVVATDDFIQVAGVGNGGDGIANLFAGSMNAISVGVLDGDHDSSTNHINSTYSGGRTRPHLVANTSVTSFATPIVAAASALLIETGRNPLLSNGTILSSAGRNNYTLQHAETSEVIRSALMAGADRNAPFQNGNHTYQRTTANGLDSHYGAGELDVYNSYHIIAAGEQNSREIDSSSEIEVYGIDYENTTFPNFSDTKRTYRFTIEEGAPREFAATLSWNLQFSGNPSNISNADLHDLNLALFEIGSGDVQTLIQSSTDSNDTTENLYLADLGPGTYEIVVDANYTVGFTVDYGLSWRFMANDPMMGDVDLDGKVSLDDLLTIKQNFNRSSRALWTDGDLNGDGVVDRSDLSMLLSNYGANTAPTTVTAMASAVPEPSTYVLLLIALGSVCFFRRRLFTKSAARN